MRAKVNNAEDLIKLTDVPDKDYPFLIVKPYECSIYLLENHEAWVGRQPRRGAIKATFHASIAIKVLSRPNRFRFPKDTRKVHELLPITINAAWFGAGYSTFYAIHLHTIRYRAFRGDYAEKVGEAEGHAVYTILLLPLGSEQGREVASYIEKRLTSMHPALAGCVRVRKVSTSDTFILIKLVKETDELKLGNIIVGRSRRRCM